MLGDFVEARALFEQCHGLDDPACRAVYATLTAEDPHVTLLAWLGVSLTYLGYIDQGRARMSEAISQARRLRHAYSLSFALLWAAWTESATNSLLETQRHATECLALSNEHGFSYTLAWGLIFVGWTSSALGQPQEGVDKILKGFALCRAMGGVSNAQLALARLAEAYAKFEQLDEGLNCLAEAAQFIVASGDRLNEAEVPRVQGDLLSAQADLAQAEQCYREALAAAIRQDAKVLELRAATSLARLWHDQGKRTEARDLLAPIYGWFTEGFDTPVLQDAKALLDQLA